MKLTILGILFTSLMAFGADEKPKDKFSHESDASIVLSSGNSDTQTYSLKQVTQYEWEKNTFKFTGSYLYGHSSGIDQARKWDLGLRYDRDLSEKVGVFLGYVLDGDIFSGFETRHSVDLGGKYKFIKDPNTELNSELGYRLQSENHTDGSSLTSHLSRLYAEWLQKWSASVSTKLWAEYLQDFKDTSNYRLNVEPSISVILSSAFSLKVAYLINYRNEPAQAGKKQTDTLYTTSLVAKF